MNERQERITGRLLIACGILFLLVVVAAGAYTLRPSNRMDIPEPTLTALAAENPDATRPEALSSVLVLNYHKIDSIPHALSIHPDDFRWQMEYLKDHGYTTISPDELMAGIEGRAELPPKPVLVTLDDGYQDNYENAYPVLQELDMKATIFVVTSFMDGKDGYLNWDECREMEQNGITIASHTVDHRSMTDLTDSELKDELTFSKKAAEAELGHPVNYIAYPTGTYNLHIANLAKEAGYKAAFTIKYGNADNKSNIYAIERVPVFHTPETNKDFVHRISYTPLFQKYGWAKH